MNNKCKINFCIDNAESKGYCDRHYKQMRRNGYVHRYTPYDPNKIKIHNDYAIVYLKDRKGETIGESLIDIEDVKKVSELKWSMNNGYARNKNSGYMHRMIMDYPDGKQIDHINGNKLDNRKENMRIVTNQQNSWNSRIYSNNTSGHTGVYWFKQRKKWVSGINVDGKFINLGYTSDKKIAVKRRIEAEEKFFGAYKRERGIEK